MVTFVGNQPLTARFVQSKKERERKERWREAGRERESEREREKEKREKGWKGRRREGGGREDWRKKDFFFLDNPDN